MGVSSTDGVWFAELLIRFAPQGAPPPHLGPHALIQRAGRQAFALSSLCSLPPGPFAFATLIPEAIALTRLQLVLVYHLADLYQARASVNQDFLLELFARQAGLSLGRTGMKVVGRKTIENNLQDQLLGTLAAKVGAALLRKMAGRGIGRLFSFAAAPWSGWQARQATLRLGGDCVQMLQEQRWRGRNC